MRSDKVQRSSTSSDISSSISRYHHHENEMEPTEKTKSSRSDTTTRTTPQPRMHRLALRCPVRCSAPFHFGQSDTPETPSIGYSTRLSAASIGCTVCRGYFRRTLRRRTAVELQTNFDTTTSIQSDCSDGRGGTNGRDGTGGTGTVGMGRGMST